MYIIINTKIFNFDNYLNVNHLNCNYIDSNTDIPILSNNLSIFHININSISFYFNDLILLLGSVKKIF